MSFGLLLKHSNTSAYHLQGNVIYCSIEHSHGDIVFLSTGLKSATVCFRSELQTSPAALLYEGHVKWAQLPSTLGASESTAGSRLDLREVQVNTPKGVKPTKAERLPKGLVTRESAATSKRYPTVLVAPMVEHSAEHRLSPSTERSCVLDTPRGSVHSTHVSPEAQKGGFAPIKKTAPVCISFQSIPMLVDEDTITSKDRSNPNQRDSSVHLVRPVLSMRPQGVKRDTSRLATPSASGQQIWNELGESPVTSIRATGVSLSGSNESLHSSTPLGYPIMKPSDSFNMVGIENVELLGEPKLVLPTTLYKSRQRLLVWAKLSKMWRTGHRLRGFILNSVKGGYAVAIAGYIAFLPRSLIQDTHIFRNQWRRFAILNMKPRIRNIVVKDLGSSGRRLKTTVAGLTRKGVGGGRVRGPQMQRNSTEMRVRTRRSQSNAVQPKRGDTRGVVFRPSRAPSTGESHVRMNGRTSSPRHANATKQSLNVNRAVPHTIFTTAKWKLFILSQEEKAEIFVECSARSKRSKAQLWLSLRLERALHQWVRRCSAPAWLLNWIKSNKYNKDASTGSIYILNTICVVMRVLYEFLCLTL